VRRAAVGAIVSSMKVRLAVPPILPAVSRSSIVTVWLPSAEPSVAKAGAVVEKFTPSVE
jgi:hypothetical protein